jgi:hypothetical protein
MNTRATQLFKKSWNFVKEKNRDLTGFRIMLAGGAIGGIQGGYSAFQASKHDDIISNYCVTLAGAVFGSSVGLLLGTVWPISVPFLFMRLYDRGFSPRFFGHK